MGLFRRNAKIIDRVWLNSDMKFRDVFNLIAKTRSNGQMPIIIYHFPDSGKHFKSVAEEKGMRTHAIVSMGDLNASTPDRWRERTDIVLLKSDGISKHDISDRMRTSQKPEFAPLLIERYPLPGQDQLILKVTSKRSDMDRLISFVALDEAWLKEVASDRIINLMEKLGVDESEVLEHAMISSSLTRAQEKLEKQVKQETKQNSLEKWLEVNLSP